MEPTYQEAVAPVSPLSTIKCHSHLKGPSFPRTLSRTSPSPPLTCLPAGRGAAQANGALRLVRAGSRPGKPRSCLCLGRCRGPRPRAHRFPSRMRGEAFSEICPPLNLTFGNEGTYKQSGHFRCQIATHRTTPGSPLLLIKDSRCPEKLPPWTEPNRGLAGVN